MNGSKDESGMSPPYNSEAVEVGFCWDGGAESMNIMGAFNYTTTLQESQTLSISAPGSFAAIDTYIVYM